MSKRWAHGRGEAAPDLDLRLRERSERDVVVARIRSRVGALTRPWWTARQVEEISPGGVRVVRSEAVECAGLLDQLAAGGLPSTAGGSSSPTSRPPATLEAVSLVREIADLTTAWLAVLRAPAPSGVAVERARLGLAELARRAPGLRPGHLDGLDQDVLSWWAQARAATSWETPPLRPHVPCMACGAVGQIRVRLEPTSATCRACGAAWDDETIGVLGNHIRLALEVAHPARDVVAEVVDQRRPESDAADRWSRSLLAGVGPDRAWAESPAPIEGDA